MFGGSYLDTETSRRFKHGIIGAGIAGGLIIIGFVIAMVKNTENLSALIISMLISLFFASVFVSQMLWGGFILDTVLFSGKVIGTPGIIFEFSLDGFIFLIAMKILFAVLRFVVLVLSTVAVIVFAIAISPFTFIPRLLTLIKHIKQGTEDSEY